MNANGIDTRIAQGIVGAPLTELQLRQLRGGLAALSVTHATARYRDRVGKACCRSFVIKSLDGVAAREAMIHQWVAQGELGLLVPRLWAVHRASRGQCRLYMEAVRPVCRWPWRELAFARQVLDALARLHASNPSKLCGALVDWDYENELAASAYQSLETFHRFCGKYRIGELRRYGPSLRRVVGDISAMRRWLLGLHPFGKTLIHGDVHPGNVMIRTRQGRPTPVFLDWGRARMASPLEDVSSWLQSLGYWEPRAKRRHDTLLAGYLASRGLAVSLGREFRRGYWIAAASNALAGALSIHLERIASGDEETRPAALHAARDALRMIRRADDSKLHPPVRPRD